MPQPSSSASADSALDRATARLSNAFARLETAISSRPAGSDMQAKAELMAKECATLTAEKEKLNLLLQEAEEKYHSLQHVTRGVAQRLDGSIRKLDLLLK